LALVMLKTGVTRSQAEKCIKKVKGNVRKAITSI